MKESAPMPTMTDSSQIIFIVYISIGLAYNYGTYSRTLDKDCQNSWTYRNHHHIFGWEFKNSVLTILSVTLDIHMFKANNCCNYKLFEHSDCYVLHN